MSARTTGDTVFGWFTLHNSAVYPLTIVAARYGGTYEGGRYLAFPCDPEAIPAGWDGGDCECSDFFHDHAQAPIGRGDTPNDAQADLAARLSSPPLPWGAAS